MPAEKPAETEAAPLDISKLRIYERYGLTFVPLFLGLLTVIALGLAAHSGETSTTVPTRPRSGFAPPSTAGATAEGDRSANMRGGNPPAPFRRRPGSPVPKLPRR